MFDFLLNYFVSPGYLLLLILLVAVTIVLCNSSKLVCLARFLIALLLILALAQPYSPLNLFGGGSSGLGILEDNSSSYEVFGPSVGQANYNLLKGVGSVDYSIFGGELVSDVGDSIIESMRDGKNVLLLSDGNVNFGEELNKVKEFSIIENLSVSTIRRPVLNHDYSISILGPDKIGPNTEATFTVQVRGTSESKRRVELEVDGKVVLAGDAGELEYVAKFDDGYHKLVARLLDNDLFGENNIYYKSVKVVEKPKILLYGDEGTPLHRSLSKLYTVDVGAPFGLDRYHSVVIDDRNANLFFDRVQDIKEYVEDGNGLVVVGGKDSFDNGKYSGSKIEEILPVKVSGVGEGEGGSKIILVIDFTSSSGSNQAASISQELAVDMIDKLESRHSLGIVLFDEGIIDSWQLEKLNKENKDAAKGWILGHSPSNNYRTNLHGAFNFSFEMLGRSSGNFILLGDGETGNLNLALRTIEGNGGEILGYAIDDPLLEEIVNSGVKIFSVAVGSGSLERDYQTLSEISDGEYYPALLSVQGINTNFGDPEGSSGSSSGVKVYSANHFITEGLILDADVLGTNQVLPKNAAELLITTSNGEPVLTVWRKGLGRVAVISTDNGNSWGGDIYRGTNSRVISRTVNWAAGDPERKKDYFFSVHNPRVKEESEIVIRGGDVPEIEDVKFSRKSDGTYAATIMPSEVGFFTFGDDEYSVNYNSEFSLVGFNEELEDLVRVSGGHVFEASENIQEVLDFLKEKKNITLVEKELFIWPLLSLAMIIFILDVWFRTVSERKNI